MSLRHGSLLVLLGLCGILCFTPPASAHNVSAPSDIHPHSMRGTTASRVSSSLSSAVTQLGSIGGAVNAVAVHGALAYFGEGTNFDIFDISNPATPTHIGRVSLPGIIEGIQVAGQLAFVADGAGGLQLVDISTPTQPHVRGSASLTQALNVQVVNKLAYVAAGSQGLQIIDVSNPAHPTVRGSYAASAVVDVRVVGKLAYVVAPDEFLILDVSNSAQPSKLGSFPVEIGTGSGVDVVGSLAYIVQEGVVPFYTSELLIVDVSDPTGPKLRSSSSVYDIALKVRVVGGLAYVVEIAPFINSSVEGIEILDVSNPTQPKQVGMYAVATPRDVQVVNNLAYIAAAGLQIVDVSNPAHPAQRGSLAIPVANTSDVDVVDGIAYVAGRLGLQIVDVHDPTNPTLLGSSPIGYTSYVRVQAGRAYAVGNGLTILDVSNPRNPTVLSTTYTFGSSPLQVVDNFVYTEMPEDPWGLAIVDVSNPASPTLRSHFDLLGGFYDLQVANNLAYVADSYGSASTTGAVSSTGRLDIVDVSNPDHPSSRGSIATMGSVYSVVLGGNFAYLGGDSFKVVDIENPQIPVLRRTANISGNVKALAGTFAYLTRYSYDIQVVDVTNPNQPTLRGYVAMPDYPSNLRVVNGLTYVADESGGLRILQINPDQLPHEIFLPLM